VITVQLDQAYLQGGADMRNPKLVGAMLVIVVLFGVTPAYTQQLPLLGTKICLDAGHGGSDPGAVNSSYNLYEKDINLDVAYGLKAMLELDGAEVVMPRTDDSYKSNRDRYTFCNAQATTILVSVHTNSVLDTSWDGSMVLYFHSDDMVLAQHIQQVMYPYLRDTSPHPDPQWEYFLDFGLEKYASGVLLKSDMPAAMVEPLFMSNPLEADLLVTPIYLDYGSTLNPACQDCRRAQIVQAVHDGILDYFVATGDTPPTVTLTHPQAGTTVSDTVMATADASDDHGVAQVEFAVDGMRIGIDDDGEDGWSAVWDTTVVVDGSHELTATATDTAGQTSSDSIAITVQNSGGGPGIVLTATGYKVKGVQKADLAWSGASSARVDIYRDGVLLATTPNDGFHTDDIGQRGGGSYTYQVCEEGTSTCSNQASITF
jgi:N-acetylmuramoyl-L-alanine amidase